MKALVRRSGGARLETRGRPELRPGNEVLIRVRRAAICRTDLFAANGQLPVSNGRILGHEFAGEVEAMSETGGSDGSDLKIGDRVMVNPSLPCGECPDCTRGLKHLCALAGFLGLTRNGAFAEYVVTPREQLFKIPVGLSFETAAYAEPIAAGMAVLDSGLQTADRIAVLGGGRIASLTEMILRDHGFNSVTVMSHVSGESEFDAVVEAGICAKEYDGITQMLQPGGTLVLKSRIPGVIPLNPLNFIRKRITICSVNYAPFPEAVTYLAQIAHKLQAYIGNTYSLDDFASAFEEAAMETNKVFFRLNDEAL